MLEILIPTYNRPESAARAIESCLGISDPRLTVNCHSNGYEPSLEMYRSLNKRVTYDCFEENRGVHANILYLLKNTKANYCMLLSDEDWLDERGAQQILDFLDGLPNVVKVVSCSIFDEIKDDYYSLTPVSRFCNFSLNTYLMTGMPVPSYMSGLTFSTDALRELNLEKLYRQSMGSAYPHLDTVMKLLEQGRLRFYNNKFVIKGAEVCFGGDGFSHRLSTDLDTSGNLNLNPLVYGPRARARQFYYQDQVISNAVNAGELSRTIAKLHNFVYFWGVLRNSASVTIFTNGCDIRTEVVIALSESVANNEWSGSFSAVSFVPFVRLPGPIGTLVYRIVTNIRLVYNKLAWCLVGSMGENL